MSLLRTTRNSVVMMSVALYPLSHSICDHTTATEQRAQLVSSPASKPQVPTLSLGAGPCCRCCPGALLPRLTVSPS